MSDPGSQVEPVEGPRCPACGAPLEASATQCPCCGQALELPPQTAPEAAPVTGGAAEVSPPVDVGAWVKTGWETFTGNIAVAIALMLLVVAPLIAFVVIGYFGFVATTFAMGALGEAESAGPVVAAMWAVFGVLFGFFLVLVLPALQAGIYACLLEGVRTGRVTAAHWLDGFRHWWACTWVSWVLGAAWVACLPFIGLFLVGMVVQLGLCALWWLALFRIVDARRGGMEALSFAWNTMRGRMWRMLAFTVFALSLTAAGGGAAYLGVVVSVPFGVAVSAAAYDWLSKQEA